VWAADVVASCNCHSLRTHRHAVAAVVGAHPAAAAPHKELVLAVEPAGNTSSNTIGFANSPAARPQALLA
jgi:hypothetical protein